MSHHCPPPMNDLEQRAHDLFWAMMQAPYADTTIGNIVCAETTVQRLESAWIPLITAALSAQPRVAFIDAHEAEMLRVIDQRDRYHEIADDLAAGIADIIGVDIGEHSSSNCPWENALEAAKGWDAQAYRTVRDELESWKGRAVEAEASNARLVHALNEANGPTHMGEPVLAAPQPREVRGVGFDPDIMARRVRELTEFINGRCSNEEAGRRCLGFFVQYGEQLTRTLLGGDELAAPKGDSDGLAEFTEYFVKNYPGPDTIIGHPEWHAPRIFRAAQCAINASIARLGVGRVDLRQEKVALSVAAQGLETVPASADGAHEVQPEAIEAGLGLVGGELGLAADANPHGDGSIHLSATIPQDAAVWTPEMIADIHQRGEALHARINTPPPGVNVAALRQIAGELRDNAHHHQQEDREVGILADEQEAQFNTELAERFERALAGDAAAPGVGNG